MISNSKLKQYSLFASTFLFTKQVYNEVVYTDVDPDIVLEFTDDIGIDMDNNGTYDFAFLKYSHSYIIITSVSSESVTMLRDQVWAGPYYIENRIACPWLTFSGSPAYLPYALSEGILIDDDLSFQNYGYQLLAVRIDAMNSTTTQYLSGTGNWWPESIDHYLGVSFIDESSNYHYGWIRCSVIDSIEKFVIKDYAYETEENYPIVAGDTSTYVNTLDLENNLKAVVYSFNKILYINLDQAFEPWLYIYDLHGNTVLKEKINSKNEVIPLNTLSTGIYIVELRDDYKVYRNKIAI